jgi:hypothetical protein
VWGVTSLLLALGGKKKTSAKTTLKTNGFPQRRERGKK